MASHGNTIIKISPGGGNRLLAYTKEDSKKKWENILQLYNQLLQIEYSPIAALNRTYALIKGNGKTGSNKRSRENKA